MKICDLKPGMSRVEVGVEVVDVSVPKKVLSRGIEREILELKVKDETGTMTLVLWDDRIIGDLEAGDNLQIKNGFVSSFRGDWRINVGMYGEIKKV